VTRFTGAIGRVLTVAGKPATIVGIAPRGFRGLNLAEFPEMYLPLNTVADVGDRFQNFLAEPTHPSSPFSWVTIVGRIDAGSTATRDHGRPAPADRCATVRLLLLVRTDARRGEFAMCLALGASRRQLAAIVLAETGRLIGLGVAAGLLLAWMGAGLIRAFLFRVQPFDPATLVAVPALILLLALAVSLRPAWHAASVDLGRILRDE
jgi:hypothetical protein